jgi:isoleucyl-tRNA synthetase
LHECLVTVTLLLAPYCPFITDELYANLTGSADSVHLADWPTRNATRLDPALDAEMELAREVTSLGRAARTEAKTPVRQPLSRAFVLLPSGANLRDEVVTEIATELNVKQVEVVTSLEGMLDYTVVPNFKALGPRLKTQLPRVKALLADVDGADVRRAFEATGEFVLDVDGTAVTLGPDDLQVRAQQHEELALAQDGDVAVALDLTLDDDLRAEGSARELVRLVNDRRKAVGLDLADRIRLTIYADGRLAASTTRFTEWIGGEVLAVELDVKPFAGSGRDADAVIDGEPVAITVGRA